MSVVAVVSRCVRCVVCCCWLLLIGVRYRRCLLRAVVVFACWSLFVAWCVLVALWTLAVVSSCCSMAVVVVVCVVVCCCWLMLVVDVCCVLRGVGCCTSFGVVGRWLLFAGG